MVRRFRNFEKEALASGVRTRQQMVVMASANPIEEDAEDAGGFDMVLSKPISRSELASVLLQYLRSLEATGLQAASPVSAAVLGLGKERVKPV